MKPDVAVILNSMVTDVTNAYIFLLDHGKVYF